MRLTLAARFARAGVLCSAILAVTSSASGAPITPVAISGTPFGFFVSLNSPGVTTTAAYAFSGAVSTWSYDFTIAESDGGLLGADVLHAFGKAWHRIGPHGEGRGQEFHFDVTLVSGSGGIAPFDTDEIQFRHRPQHFDYYIATLSAQDAFGDLTNYSLFLNGQHRDMETPDVPLPEPTALTLLTLGLGRLVVRRRKRLSPREESK